MNFVVYLLMAIAVIFASFSQQGKMAAETDNGIYVYKYDKFNFKYLLVSFLILGGICFFCKSGVDIPGYVYNYTHWDWSSLSDVSREPGYKLLNILLSRIVSDPYIGLGIIKLLSLGLVFYSAYIVKNKINIGMAVLSYCCLLYIYNFQLLRLMLALGIVFLALSFEMNEKPIRCMVLLVAAFFFHYTSIFVLLAYAGTKILGRKMTVSRAIIIGAVLIFMFQNSVYIINRLLSNVVYFQKYESYTRGMNESVGIGGIGQLLFFVPVLIVLISNYKNEHENKTYAFHFILGIMTFACGALGYLLPNTRMTYYFYYFFFYYCAALPLKRERFHIKLGRSFSVGLKSLFIICYLLLRFVLYLVTGGIQSNGLEIYQFIWT